MSPVPPPNLYYVSITITAVVLFVAGCDTYIAGALFEDVGHGGEDEIETVNGQTVFRAAEEGWTATFTSGARTVVFSGASRTLDEPAAGAAVVTNQWVRLLPEAFDGDVDASWVYRAANEPDVFEIALQYVEGATDVPDRYGRRIAGDADYGPLLADGSREEGSDFNDYLQIPWSYGRVTDMAETRQTGSLDCSGFVRMVFGYRLGMPLSLRPSRAAIPRRAVMMEESMPGIRVIANTGDQVTNFEALQPGDLLFFDVSDDDLDDIDHVGIYLGVDADGDHRFISSRKTMNGPTLGDRGGRSIINGDGYYARGFRSARRI